MNAAQYNKLYDEIKATIKGSAVAMSKEQRVVRDVMQSHEISDHETCESMMEHFGEMVL